MDSAWLRRHSAAVAAVAAVLTLGGFVGGIVLEGANGPNTLNSTTSRDIALGATWLSVPLIGAVLAWRRPANRVGWLLAAMGVALGLGVLFHALAVYALITEPGARPLGQLAAWMATWLFVPAFGLGGFVIATFPDGEIDRSGLRRFAFVGAGGLVLLTVGQAFAPDNLDAVAPSAPPIANPFGVGALEWPVGIATLVGALVVVGFALAALADLAGRYRHARGEQRLQLLWPAVGLVIVPVTLIPAIALGDGRLAGVLLYGGQMAGAVVFAGGIAVSVLRFRLYDLAVFVQRTATYVALSGCVVVAYVAIVSVVALVLPTPHRWAAVVATALVALAVGPLRATLQHRVDRLLYGNRADPYAVLSSMGARLEATLAPDAVLPAVVDSVATSLKLPYAAIALEDRDRSEVVAAHGARPAEVVAMPLVFHNRRLGDLLVAQRSPDEPFTAEEIRLLTNLSTQVSVVTHAVGLTRALEQSRQRLVRSQEEERRRLRRDLHDGLGPALAGMALQVDAAIAALDGDPGDAEPTLRQLKSTLRNTVEDVRRLVHDLRPPMIDELGLLDALRHQAASLDASRQTGPRIECDLPPSLPELPAAVEVAAFRIASEAMTNVVRHAHASTSRVRLAVTNGHLDLEIVDNGIGPPSSITAGLGLTSMRERALELAGVCSVEAAADGGTRVHARLPIAL